MTDGYTAVRTETLQWLLGERGDFECPADQYFRGKPTPYFWRTRLRKALFNGVYADHSIAVKSQQEAVAWQVRRIDPDEGPSLWQNAELAHLKHYSESRRPDGAALYEIRSLYTSPQAGEMPPTADAPESANDAVAFKAFHRLLCERFGYSHDEYHWRRDLVSLIEWIGRRVDDERGEVVVTTDATGRCVLVARQDSEHRILSVIWEASACPKPPAGWDCTRVVGHEGPCAAHPIADRLLIESGGANG